MDSARHRVIDRRAEPDLPRLKRLEASGLNYTHRRVGSAHHRVCQLQTLLIMVVNTGEFCHYGYSSLFSIAMTTMNIPDRRPR